MINPAVFTAAGQQINQLVYVQAIVWEGSSTAGDTVTLSSAKGLFWSGRTDGTQTYLGVTLIHPIAIDGLKLDSISSGRVFVYFAEP